MGFVLAQIALQRLIQLGIKYLKDNPDTLDEIFCYYTRDALNAAYGQPYIDKIKEWFNSNKIPVVQAWNMDSTNVPGISVRLAQETEAIDKAAVGDLGYFDESGEVGVGVMQVNLDVGIHASKTADEILWLYYIASYILFSFKRNAEALGLELHTYSATDHMRNDSYLGDNIWTRNIRLSTTVQNTWSSDKWIEPTDLDIEVNASSTGTLVESDEDDINIAVKL